MPVMTRMQMRRRQKASRLIQSRVREHLQVRNCVDPITLEPIARPYYRCVDLKSNHVSYFDLSSLLDFLESTGDFRHPISREPLHPAQVLALQNQALRELPQRKCSVYAQMADLERKRKEASEMRAMFEFLSERILLLVDVSLEMCSAVELRHMEIMAMLTPWAMSVQMAIVTLQTFLCSWEDRPPAEDVIEQILSAANARYDAAISGPYYHSELHVQFSRSVLRGLLHRTLRGPNDAA